MSKVGLWKAIILLCLFCALGAIGSQAQTLTTLYSFCSQGGSSCTDGSRPIAGLVQGADGNFYGTTPTGGGAVNCAFDGNPCGTVFKITPSGTLTTLHAFEGTDGDEPADGLVQGTDGNFYGTTSQIGANNGGGTVFKITSSGTLTTLYNFCEQSGCTDGAVPSGSLVQATDGNFYGTTTEGGTNGSGTVFKISPSGALTTLYSFCSQSGCADGDEPIAGLAQGTDGNFYGTTDEGGANGQGTVFRITPTGSLSTLYNFCSQTGCTDGANPYGTLVQGTDGNFYGTTYDGGANGNDGTVFKITAHGKFTTLHSFCEQSLCADGKIPHAGVVQGTDGNFYGTTTDGGPDGSDYGTVFRITRSGTLVTLYTFCSQTSCTDGDNPYASLVQGTDGHFYGTTVSGGTGGSADNGGTAFRLGVGLRPFVETLPTSGRVGTPVSILGNNLTGTTSVTFNGTPTTKFKVASSTEIRTIVPSGATTGYIQVTTPKGTLTSNVKFRVP